MSTDLRARPTVRPLQRRQAAPSRRPTPPVRPAARTRKMAPPPVPAGGRLRAAQARKPLQRRIRRTRRSAPAFELNFTAGHPRRRLQVVFVVAVVLFLAVIVRVVFLQTAGSDSLLAAGKAQRVTESTLHAPRGTIFASDGGELALSVPSSTVIANPKLVTDPTGEAAVLSSMLGLPADKRAALVQSFTSKDKSFIFVARQVDDQLAASVMSLNLAGIDVLHEDKRIMPDGDVGRSVLGRTNIDGVGIAGLEKQYDSLLTGTDGERVREHDARGRSIPSSGATTKQPIPGQDLVLTLDRSLQYQVERALVTRVTDLKAKGGTVVVMDTSTGAIYAMANVQKNTDGSVSVTNANMAAVDAFEPGSVAKVFSLSAVVDSGIATPDTVVQVPGKLVFDAGTLWEHTLSDAEPHPLQPMSMRQIITRSSNLGTFELASKLPDGALGTYLDAFGFGHRTALAFEGENVGLLPPANTWQGTEKATVTYGYHYAATSVQLAAAVNTVANGGVYVAPRLLKATIGADGRVHDAPASATHQVLKPDTAATMVSLMQSVVCDPRGTGTAAQIPGMPVAGKTGTAYKAVNGGYGTDTTRAYRATFVGFFPAEAPRVTILVTIDEPDPTSNDRFGGTAAAPLFTKVATAAIHELQITPGPGDTTCPTAG